MKKVLILILILVSGCTGNVVKEEFEGPFLVVDVIDGDTADLNNSERLRFSGINTPETGECYYQEAKDKLKELILDKEVYLEKDISDRGKYGRLLRYIYVNGSLVNKEMVRLGYAKVYDKYKDDTKRYDELKEVEFIAKREELGVWVCEDVRAGCKFVGSVNSDKYHTSDCKYSKRIKPVNLICFDEAPEDREFSGC